MSKILFKKGHKPMGRSLPGHVTSEETKKKISIARKGQPSAWKGKKHSDETRKIISQNRKGIPSHRKGKSFSQISGENNGNWKGGYTDPLVKIRGSFNYKSWRRSVIERDKKCIWCFSENRLEADHIKPFRFFPELRFAIDNGRTLCRDCHKTTDNYGGKSKVWSKHL